MLEIDGNGDRERCQKGELQADRPASRGRHTTTASELVRLPDVGWLIDTPGVRAVSLWSSGRGIEWAFADVFDLMDHCAAGTLDPRRLDSLKRLVAEEAALEDEQREQERALDRRGVRRPRPR